MTGIEIAADSCALVDVRRRNGVARLSAVHVVEPSEWPPVELAQVRRENHFSRDAHVVSWTSDESALRPFREAGFKIGTVIGPERALGMLAEQWPRAQTESATAWLAISRHGAALAIVRRGEVLYSRRIDWRYRTATRPNEQLLQRYLLVSHLAPELQHGIDVVRDRYGTTVDGAVTCGNLPELRSLTMPLIEELNLEVETLDRLDGLELSLSPPAMAQRALDYAPALRLASAVTALPPVDGPRRARWWVGAAAVLVAIAGVAGWWVATRVSDDPIPSRRAVAPAPPPPSPAATAGSPSSEPPVVPLIPRSRPAVRSEAPAPRGEPLPTLSSILIAPNRRLAILDGNIVGEGDAVGNRRVVRIERGGVVLRELAGQEVRVEIRRPKQASQP
jgi:hypothetical protein